MADATPDHVGQLSPDGLWLWDGTAWRSAQRELPVWFTLRTRSEATWAVLIGAAIVGLLLDQALRVNAFGLGASATVLAAAAALAFAGGLRWSESRAMVGVAALFAVWLSVRESPWLLWPDLAASLILLALAASVAVRGSIFDLGTAELAARSLHGLGHLATGMGFAARPLAASRGRLRLLGPLSRGLLIAMPIVVVVSVLLASADPVFASFFNLNLDPLQLLSDALFIALGVVGMAGLMRLAHSEGIDQVDGPLWRLGATEALVVLALLDAVFAAFALAQVLAATGAAAGTLRAAGVTYADYARSGFFQLLWVSGITLVVLVLFSRITGFRRPEHRVAFTLLAETAIVLTLVIVAVAFGRLSLYEEAYGFTMLRLYSHIFAGWIAFVFLLLAADLLGVWRGRRWFVGVGLASAFAVLLSLNFANPEALVVALNVNHAQSSHKLDADYFRELTSDATPTLLGAVPGLNPSLRAGVQGVACSGGRSYSPSWAAFNWSAADAAGARRQDC